MKPIIFFLVVLLNAARLLGQDAKTSAENSPAVIARNFSATYGIRADAVEDILWIYEAEGYDVDRRKRATEQIIREYAQSPEKQQKTDVLSDATRRKLGINDAPKIANALEWDLFARSHYLSTTGQNSPAVIAQGDVNIWYGIPPKVLRALVAHLEKKITHLSNFETQIADQVKKFDELSKSLVNREDEMAKEAKLLLDEGKIEEAVQVLKDRRVALRMATERSKKREAEGAIDYADGLALEMKYDLAAIQYRDAIILAPNNSNYLLLYAYNEHNLAHYDEAIVYYQKALAIDSVVFKNEHEKVAKLYNNIGSAWQDKGEYDHAMTYFEKALEIYLQFLDGENSGVSVVYSNIGTVWIEKDEYGLAIDFFEKALAFDSTYYGNQDKYVARDYNNIGAALIYQDSFDLAITFLEKSLAIDLIAYGNQHPSIAASYNNLGSTWLKKDSFDIAITFFEKAFKIDSIVYGPKHPEVATNFNNLGMAWQAKGKYDYAIEYFEKCLSVLVLSFPPQYRYRVATVASLALATYNRGDELFNEKKYAEALPYFKKSLDNADTAKSWFLSLHSFNSIGATYKNLGLYADGLAALKEGVKRAEHLNIDELFSEFSAATPQQQELQNEISELQKLKRSAIHRMHYHKVGCLKGLKRNKEADILAKQLWQEGIEANDSHLLEDLRKEGYDFGKN